MKKHVTKKRILELLKENREILSAEYSIKKIGIFGSFANGNAAETSDIDLIVELEKPIGFKFVELAEFLEKLLGRKVDLLTPAGIKGIRIPGIAKSIAEQAVYV